MITAVVTSANNPYTLPKLQIVRMENHSILEQLQLEEALLRASTSNWCLLNQGSSPAIVLGISGKVDEFVNRDHLQRAPIPLIRRFSGGGTVVVGKQTLFVTLIVNQKDLPDVACYPEAILRWTELLYAPLFGGGVFRLNANDYGIGDRKFGGNAQYLCKDRWLHHTSLLWDYEDSAMNYLLQPKRQPSYRANRSHGNFLCRLRDYLPNEDFVFEGIERELAMHFCVQKVTVAEASEFEKIPHRQTTKVL